MNYQTGERHAERVLEQEGLDNLPICPRDIAARHDIVVKPKPAKSEGVTGFLMRMGSDFLICHASHLSNDGFIRFTIAHELGHYFIPGHPEALFGEGDGVHVSRAFSPNGNRFEQEADGFASALLMPRQPFIAAMREHDPGFDAIEALGRSVPDLNHGDGDSLRATRRGSGGGAHERGRLDRVLLHV
jgi:hypothetical protein